MGTKTGELRETLIEAIEQVRAGKMDASQAKSIAMLAGQVNLSLQVEINMRRELLDMGAAKDAVPQIGATNLGEVEQRPALESVVTTLPEPAAIEAPAARVVKGSRY